MSLLLIKDALKTDTEKNDRRALRPYVRNVISIFAMLRDEVSLLEEICTHENPKEQRVVQWFGSFKDLQIKGDLLLVALTSSDPMVGTFENALTIVAGILGALDMIEQSFAAESI